MPRLCPVLGRRTLIGPGSQAAPTPARCYAGWHTPTSAACAGPRRAGRELGLATLTPAAHPADPGSA